MHNTGSSYCIIIISDYQKGPKSASKESRYATMPSIIFEAAMSPFWNLRYPFDIGYCSQSLKRPLNVKSMNLICWAEDYLLKMHSTRYLWIVDVGEGEHSLWHVYWWVRLLVIAERTKNFKYPRRKSGEKKLTQVSYNLRRAIKIFLNFFFISYLPPYLVDCYKKIHGSKFFSD